MTIARARVIKATPTTDHGATSAPTAVAPSPSAAHGYARRVPREIVEASTAAARILEDARASAAAVAEAAAREAREREIARVAAELVALRIVEEERAARSVDRTIEIAKVLAERIIGDALAIDPARIGALAVEALRQTRGARQIRVEASPSDVEPLRAILAELAGAGAMAPVLAIDANAELGRGSLVVHTELGRVDARLEPQLARRAEALREALATERKAGA